MEYHIGQILKKPYPPEVSAWCMNNNAYLADYSDTQVIITAVPEETKEERKALFLKDFFKVNLGELGNGYYRKKPKGYQSAIESINTAQIICSKMNGLPAGVLIFYKQPSFSKPEQCTEEWLIAHQIVIPALSVEQFDELYLNFIQSWNKQEHE